MLGAVRNNVRTKSRKIDPLPPCSQNVRTRSIPPPSLSVRAHHKFRKIPSASQESPCPLKILTEQTSTPLTADVFYGQPLILFSDVAKGSTTLAHPWLRKIHSYRFFIKSNSTLGAKWYTVVVAPQRSMIFNVAMLCRLFIFVFLCFTFANNKK